MLPFLLHRSWFHRWLAPPARAVLSTGCNDLTGRRCVFLLPGLRIAQTLGQDVPCRVHITVVLCPALGANPLPVAQGESVLTQPQALQVLELG